MYITGQDCHWLRLMTRYDMGGKFNLKNKYFLGKHLILYLGITIKGIKLEDIGKWKFYF